MSTSALLAIRRRSALRRSRGWPIGRTAIVAAALLVVSAVFLFVDRAAMPIQLWDESRNIVNALEMRENGFALITTYGGATDLWNTKPPLLIWLMAASMGVFGPTEWALRLPSMIAALGTILLLFWFVHRTTRSTGTAALAAALMVMSPAYFGEHSARTADYDALLLFFVTAYLCLLFLALHRRRPSGALLALIGVAICCAFLTKSAAALVPGVGMVPYLLVTGRWRRPLTPGYIGLALCIVATIGAFLLLCEAQSPGYLHAAWFNDVSDRFTSPLIAGKSRWFYIAQLHAGFFAATPLLFLSPVALFFVRGRSRLVLLFSLCVTIGILAIFTCAVWKLNHYILPAIPFMAIAAAITIRLMLHRAGALWRLDVRMSRPIAAVLLLVAVIPVLKGVAGAAARRYYPLVVDDGARSGQYGALFAGLAARSDRRILVIDPGFILEGKAHYAPELLAYRHIWAARGVMIGHSTDPAMIDRAHRVTLASCNADGVARLRKKGRDIAGVDGCAAILAN